MFPFKLHQLLDDAGSEGNEHIVSWLPDGKGFKVFSRQLFEEQILPRYLRSSDNNADPAKYRSFSRQLNIYGFERVLGPKPAAENGAYRHPLFIRGKPALCAGMARHKVKSKRSSVKGPSLEPVVAAMMLNQEAASAAAFGFLQGGGSSSTTHAQQAHHMENQLLHEEHSSQHQETPCGAAGQQHDTGSDDSSSLLEFAFLANEYLDMMSRRSASAEECTASGMLVDVAILTELGRCFLPPAVGHDPFPSRSLEMAQ
jgi:hypothetical protein